MTNAEARGWGDPDERGYRAVHIVKITAGGQSLYVRREVAPLFQGFLDDLVAAGYRLDEQDDDWGYINRDIRGRPGVKSNHSWGLAVDINAAKNPMGDRLVTDLPANVSAMARKWGLTWGGDYRGRKDAMHFEVEGTPDEVRKLIASHRNFPSRTEDITIMDKATQDYLDKRFDALDTEVAILRTSIKGVGKDGTGQSWLGETLTAIKKAVIK